MIKFILLTSCLFISINVFSQGLLKREFIDTSFRKQIFHTFISLTTKADKNGQAIPQNFYTQCFGFFCRQELKMQQAHVPLTFRLGSMDYCNWLEQKPGYSAPN